VGLALLSVIFHIQSFYISSKIYTIIIYLFVIYYITEIFTYITSHTHKPSLKCLQLPGQISIGRSKSVIDRTAWLYHTFEGLNVIKRGTNQSNKEIDGCYWPKYKKKKKRDKKWRNRIDISRVPTGRDICMRCIPSVLTLLRWRLTFWINYRRERNESPRNIYRHPVVYTDTLGDNGSTWFFNPFRFFGRRLHERTPLYARYAIISRVSLLPSTCVILYAE